MDGMQNVPNKVRQHILELEKENQILKEEEQKFVNVQHNVYIQQVI